MIMTHTQYNILHQACPDCGNTELIQTCKGAMISNHQSEDTNQAQCGCGWSGITHELVPKEEGTLLKRLVDALILAEQLFTSPNPSSAAKALIILSGEYTKAVDLLVGYTDGRNKYTTPIIQYLLDKGILKHDGNGVLPG